MPVAHPPIDPRWVLITRPQAEAAATAERVAALGFIPVLAPLLRIETLHVALPANPQAILVTSGNALAGLRPGPPLYAVGDATAEAARRVGFTAVFSAGRDADTLAALTIARLAPDAGPLLLAVGHNQGRALAGTLRRAGFRVIRRVVYRAYPARSLPSQALEALAAGRLHAALFLSAATARVFTALADPGWLGGMRAVAISQAAAAALRSSDWRELRIAPAPTLDAVLTQL